MLHRGTAGYGLRLCLCRPSGSSPPSHVSPGGVWKRRRREPDQTAPFKVMGSRSPTALIGRRCRCLGTGSREATYSAGRAAGACSSGGELAWVLGQIGNGSPGGGGLHHELAALPTGPPPGRVGACCTREVASMAAGRGQAARILEVLRGKRGSLKGRAWCVTRWGRVSPSPTSLSCRPRLEASCWY